MRRMRDCAVRRQTRERGFVERAIAQCSCLVAPAAIQAQGFDLCGVERLSFRRHPLRFVGGDAADQLAVGGPAWCDRDVAGLQFVRGRIGPVQPESCFGGSRAVAVDALGGEERLHVPLEADGAGAGGGGGFRLVPRCGAGGAQRADGERRDDRRHRGEASPALLLKSGRSQHRSRCGTSLCVGSGFCVATGRSRAGTGLYLQGTPEAALATLREPSGCRTPVPAPPRPRRSQRS